MKSVSHLPELDRVLHLSTPKVCALLELLETCAGWESQSTSAVIFVQMRWTAIALAKMLKRVSDARANGLVGLRLDHVIGGQTGYQKNASKAEQEENMKEKVKTDETLRAFRSGDLNCLVSTSVLEEGMDVKTCNLVVR